MRRSLTISAWFGVICAILLWAGFGLFVVQLSKEKARYASLQADGLAREDREKISAQLRELIRDTAAERAALRQLSETDVLAAAATIEAAGKAAGVDVSIGSAATIPLGGKQTSELHAVVVVAHAEGSFASLMQAASLFESLPFPSSVESYELQTVPSTSDRVSGLWTMTSRIRIITPSNVGT